MTVFSQLQTIAKQGLSGIYLIAGEDESLIGELKDQMMGLTQFDATANLSNSYFDLSNSNLAGNALTDIVSLPFFDDQRIVFFENVWDLLPAKKRSFDDKQLKEFEAYIENPVDSTVLILVLHGKPDKRKAIVKKLLKQANYLEATPLKPGEIKAYFSGQISGPALDVVMDSSGGDFGIIKQNIGLLKAYRPDGNITPEEVRQVIPKSLHDNIFEMTTHINGRQTDAALELMRDLVLQGQQHVALNGYLLSRFRLYLQVKLMKEQGQQDATIAKTLAINPFQLKYIFPEIRRLSIGYLKYAVKSLIEMDYQLKSTSADKNYLMEILVIKLSQANK
jgi:DNA polymerase-3 subunit delta